MLQFPYYTIAPVNTDPTYIKLFRQSWLADWAYYNNTANAGGRGRYGLGAGPSPAWCSGGARYIADRIGQEGTLATGMSQCRIYSPYITAGYLAAAPELITRQLLELLEDGEAVFSVPDTPYHVLWRRSMLDSGWNNNNDKATTPVEITMVDLSSLLFGLSTLWLDESFYQRYTNHGWWGNNKSNRLKSDDGVYEDDELPGVFTFGGGTDACSQKTPYCESRVSCSGVRGGRPANEVLVLNHSLNSASLLGVMDHMWHVGPSALELAVAGLQIEVRYYVDGESSPSVVFDPGMATGNAFGAVMEDGKWVDATARVGNDGLWSAGSKMGKSGLVSADWHHHPVIFQHAIRVTQTVKCLNETLCALAVPPANGYPPKGCVAGTVIVQGHEQNKRLTLRSGFTLPLEARLQLHKIEGKSFASREFVPLVNISAGNAAMLFAVMMSLEASPPWARCTDANCSTYKGGVNNYVEGCWHLLRNHQEQLPGMIVGTGLEGGLDTSYALGLLTRNLSALNRQCYPGSGGGHVCPSQGKLWQSPNTGALHFSSDTSAAAMRQFPAGGVERISTYRFFDEQVMGGNNGMIYGKIADLFVRFNIASPCKHATSVG
jgi:hypothetical protein